MQYTEYCSTDSETTGLFPYQGAQMFSYSIGNQKGETEVHRLTEKRSLIILQDFFYDTSIKKVFHHAKFDLIMYMLAGIKIPEETEIHDTLLMSQILQNLLPSHSLDYLCWMLGGISRDRDKQVKKLGQAYGGYQNIPISLMNEYQKDDAIRTMLLFDTFYPDIVKDKKLHQDYLNEIALIWTTIRMERHGICIDKKECKNLIDWMENELDTTREETRDLLGEYINLNSPIQLIRILYHKYQFPVIKLTPTHQPSTDKNTLAKLREAHPHQIHDLILKQRSYTNGISTIKSYMELAGKDGILHPTFNTNGAEKTGRESSENPNLQNVSKKAVLLNPFPVPSRKVFKVNPGCILLFADYAGIEMRLIVDDCQEQEFIEAINANKDIHHMAANLLIGIEYIEETNKKLKKVLRDATKNCHFALPYGGGPTKLAQIVNIPVEKFIHNLVAYKNRFPKVANFSKSKQKEVLENGFVLTPFGRRFYVPKDKAYMGANYYIQPTAAGVLKRAQVRVDKYLKDVWNDEIRLVLPIHDELVFSYPKKLLKYKKKVIYVLSKIMTTMPEINVKLDVEWKETSTNWDAAEEVKII